MPYKKGEYTVRIKPEKPKPRKCLGEDCNRIFKPKHKWNFICPNCAIKISKLSD